MPWKLIDPQRLRENFTEKSFLATMAADPQIQSEIHKIDEEFFLSEADGLESS